MKTADIRQAFLNYFKSKGHTIVKSSSLIPAGDPTLLFVNAGMVQFKDLFLGIEKRAYTRATTTQKCLRIQGKHNDLENVGRTARHHTFFEMLGNFSFGDYFKEDAIKFAWEFLTKELQLPKDRLWVTVFEKDDEAFALWEKHTDVLPGRILRYGEKDNFWAMGDTGPCGPCTEIHYFLGEDTKVQSEEDFRKEDGRYVEIWNNVFMQFERTPDGQMTPLPKPSVDTGMGLERIAAIKQERLSNYDNDLLRPIIAYVEQLSGKKYEGIDYRERDLLSDTQYAYDVAMRVICDHSRACVFLIADDISPSSDGRGYILRRLLRRACRHGRNLGFQEPFFYKVAEQVIFIMKDVFPEIEEKKKKIIETIKQEEIKFSETLDTGLKFLEKHVAQVKGAGGIKLSGSVAFKLHDTYGFPLDLTEDIVRAQHLTVDKEEFEQEMEAQRERSRSARASATELILQRSVKPIKSKFVGYEFVEYESEVAGLFNEGGEVSEATVGQEVALVAPLTPFYAESGGQVGDTGFVSSNSCTLEVIDTQKVGGDTIVHVCLVKDGSIKKGDKIRLEIDKDRRKKIAAHHSVTHLLHLALREVLGDHVKQAGSRVADQSFRFDYSHNKPLSSEEIEQIEMIVNREILANYSVATDIMDVEKAKQSGAMALFGEKYGEQVRVVQVCPRSRELCGGTHAARSGDLGMFAITGESSIAAGVRRVEGVCGIPAWQQFNNSRNLLRSSAELINSSEKDLVERMKKLLEHSKELERENERLAMTLSTSNTGELIEKARVLSDGTKVITTILKQANAQQLRAIADDIRAKVPSTCICLATVSEGKAMALVAVSENLTKRLHAGNTLKVVAEVMGAKGGGKADFAQAGGGDPTKLDGALKQFEELTSW